MVAEEVADIVEVEVGVGRFELVAVVGPGQVVELAVRRLRRRRRGQTCLLGP